MPTLGKTEIAVAAVSAVFFLVAAIAYFVGEKRRAEIDAALRGGRNVKRLRMFDLTRSDAMTILKDRYLAIPEKLWTYDNFYLERFAKAARQARLPRGATALDAYIETALKIDVVFAVAFGLSIALLEFGLATVVLRHWPSVGDAMMFAAAMGAVYGAADVAEDLKLRSILRDWRTATSGRTAAYFDSGDELHIEEPYVDSRDDSLVEEPYEEKSDDEPPIEEPYMDGGEAAAANALTRIKFVMIFLSILVVAVCAVFLLAAAIFQW